MQEKTWKTRDVVYGIGKLRRCIQHRKGTQGQQRFFPPEGKNPQDTKREYKWEAPHSASSIRKANGLCRREAVLENSQATVNQRETQFGGKFT